MRASAPCWSLTTGGTLAGIFSERDLLLRVPGRGRPAPATGRSPSS